ncbi:MAG: hypothetical protein ACU837_10745 [Gammaproteobacteria bacterium]
MTTQTHTETKENNQLPTEKSSKSQFTRSVRFDLENGQEAPSGSLFINRAGMYDLANVQIVGCFVDTVRQLYHGKLYDDVVTLLDRHIENDTHFHTGDLPQRECELPYDTKLPWAVQKMGKSSGYRYKLQNNEIGLVILIGSYYGKLDAPRTHVKIEASPHFLMHYPAKMAQHIMNYLSRSFMADPVPQGVAIHLACDLQGWRPPENLLSNFITYSRFIRTFDGIEAFELGDDWAEYSLRYGADKTETVMFGRPTSLQCCIYDKTGQAKRMDKIDYYHNEWAVYSLGQFDPDKPVTRVEMRFHHQVIREVNAGQYANIQSYEELEPIIKDLWQYALTRNRFELQPGLIHPVWQMMFEDAQFPGGTDIRVIRKKKQDVSAIAKNYDLIIGNMITVYARQGANVRHFMQQLKSLSWYDEFMRHLHINRHMAESEFRQKIEKELCKRRLIGKAA